MIRREFIGLVSAVCLSVSPFVARAQRSTGENGLSWRLILVRRPDFAFMFSLRCARFSYVKPSSGIFSTEPHALQCTASLSWRCRPQVGQGNRTLLGGQQRAGEIEEQGHAENHDDDRDQAADRARQGDVAKAGRRQRRDGEIQRVGIIRDLIVAKLLGFVNDPVITKMNTARLVTAKMTSSLRRKTGLSTRSRTSIR